MDTFLISCPACAILFWRILICPAQDLLSSAICTQLEGFCAVQCTFPRRNSIKCLDSAVHFAFTQAMLVPLRADIAGRLIVCLFLSGLLQQPASESSNSLICLKQIKDRHSNTKHLYLSIHSQSWHILYFIILNVCQWRHVSRDGLKMNVIHHFSPTFICVCTVF